MCGCSFLIMATGGGMVMGSEFYRVLVTGVPANSEVCTHSHALT